MITIYFEDKHLVVCKKPYGVKSQSGNGENMIDLLSSQLGCDIYPVHRLDAITEGVMVYAKTEKMAGLLSSMISARDITKEYLAVCYGVTEKEGEMTDFLFHDRIKNKSFVVDKKRGGSKEAKLEFCTLGTAFLKNSKEISLVKIRLLTGRTHQIRVQFSYRGNMLYGDGKYGASDNDRIALYSYHLCFVHPVTKVKIDIYSFPKGGAWEHFEDELTELEANA